VASSEASAMELHEAMTQLAIVAVASPNASADGVSLHSDNLNLTVQSRTATDVASGLIAVDTTMAAQPVEVSLPSTVLRTVTGLNHSLPLTLVLYTTEDTLHMAPNGVMDSLTADADADGNRALRTSAAVVFSILQEGQEVHVANVNPPINISIPFQASADTSGALPCLGTPRSAYEARACNTIVECRWWNVSASSWSTDGCTTMRGAGESFVSSCTHLTEFIAVEVSRVVAVPPSLLQAGTCH